ncbi:vanillate O-demethylase oxidoreductase VanB [Dyella monticola]|uniref:Vanillate O-demethylase oxidoreductase VanB n=1 Tax=Dyella monticola TaxID=1927958 RepID=A0A370X955_9GAMM|nr:SRPBCC family protein [Dyella monticola]RDS84944.1 vanillate O-demethylase oxidoreductase VanB [Dyella monticola]
MNSTDRIERQIHIKAPRSKVWRTLADAETFGDWFGVALKGKRFVAGEPCEGPITYPGYEHITWKVVVDRVEPEHLLSFRWHPYAIDPNTDYSHEPTTLVTFELEETSDGTLLRLVESGFDKIPAHRRAEALRMNSGGWDAQMTNIDTYVASH